MRETEPLPAHWRCTACGADVDDESEVCCEGGDNDPADEEGPWGSGEDGAEP